MPEPIRAALVHLLPPGGAWRAMAELTRRTSGPIRYELFSIDLGRWDRFGRSADLGLTDVVEKTTLEAIGLPESAVALDRFGKAADLVLWRQVAAAEDRLARRIDGGGFDVVVAHHNRFFGSPSVLRRLRTPSVYYVQEPRRANHEYRLRPERRFDGGAGLICTAARTGVQLANGWLHRIDVASARAATTLLCNSRFSAESIARAYGRTATLSPLGVDTASFSPGPEGTERANTVLSIGAVARVKGHDLVVEALARIPASRRPRLIIASERAEDHFRATLLERSSRLGVDVELASDIDDERLIGLYRTALATVCVSHLEPLGLTAMESISCGTPVVAIDEGGFRETVEHGVTGSLVARDPGRLAEALDAIIVGDRRFDPGVLRSVALDRFDWDRGVGVYLDRLIATASAARPDHRASSRVAATK